MAQTGVGMTIINRWRHLAKSDQLPDRLTSKTDFQKMIDIAGFGKQIPAGGAINVLQIFASLEG